MERVSRPKQFRNRFHIRTVDQEADADNEGLREEIG